jgi:hypothetical protein
MQDHHERNSHRRRRVLEEGQQSFDAARGRADADYRKIRRRNGRV